MSDPLQTADPDVDMFLALARSSPWRWRTLHFRYRSVLREAGVEAWLRRPGDLLVETADGRRHPIRQQRRRSTKLTATRVATFTPPDGGPPRPVTLPPFDAVREPVESEPVLRPDGLVARRPRDWEYEHDDPMWDNYTWVAMLDPVELSHHVDVRNLRRAELAGRPVWRADLRALPGYDPRCGSDCCELLWSEVSWYADFGGIDDPDPEAPPIPADVEFPDHHDVALDVETGVVVRLTPVGGSRPDWVCELDILEVDADQDDVFA